jgi:hypothetical protein
VTPRCDTVTGGAVLYVPPASHSGPCTHALWQRGIHPTVGRRMLMPLIVMEARFFVPRARDSRSDGPRVDP